mmetsp:Transcript_36548/g.103215  ORF Transcript_36548/g.103215 Transcript_36548/m.103215 type:complete len:314 (+) Transcript_36548:128-1069(+)
MMRAAIISTPCPAASLQGRAVVTSISSGFRHRPCRSWRQINQASPAYPGALLLQKSRFGPGTPKAAEAEAVKPEGEVEGMTSFLDSLKFNYAGLVVVIVQDVDSGSVLMQAYADRNAICETVQTGLATFYSRSRKGRWCKGETSGNFIYVQQMFADCDRDSIIYLSVPKGPSCHTGSRTCWFTEATLGSGAIACSGEHTSEAHSPKTTLQQLEETISHRKAEIEVDGVKPSWTAKLLTNEELLCSKIREEAGELCQTLEAGEGKERAASEMADLLYHSMVLLNLQGVSSNDVMKVLRKRFGTSGIDEKASRNK